MYTSGGSQTRFVIGMLKHKKKIVCLSIGILQFFQTEFLEVERIIYFFTKKCYLSF